MKNIKKLQCLMLIIFIITFGVGFIVKECNIMMIAILLISCSNIIFSLLDLKNEILFFVFNSTFFILLLGKNAVLMLCNNDIYPQFDQNVKIETLVILFLALISLSIGKFIAEKFCKKIKAFSKFKFTENKKQYIQKITLYAFYVSLICAYIVQLEKILFVFNNSYLELYKSFNTHLPYVVLRIAEMNFLFLVMYLVTFPKKIELLKVFIPYGIYLILTLLVGTRGEIVIKSLFICIYLFYRQLNFKDEIYYTKKVIVTLVVILIFSIIFFRMYNLLRNRIEIKDFNPIQQVKHFFLDQGASGDTLAYSVKYKEKLRELNQNYTFGHFVNRFKDGKIIKTSNENIGENDKKINAALYENNLGASISYIVLGDRYLKGEGLGTQYLAELYTDYSYVGVIIYNLILGYLLILCMKTDAKNWIINTIIFFLIPNAIYLPRQFASDILIYFISMKVYFQFALVIILATICEKYNIKKGEKNENSLDS